MGGMKLRDIGSLIGDMDALEQIAARNPSAVGELLRDIFFDQSNGGYGCYDTFDLRPDVTPLPSEPVEDDPGMKWTRAEKGGVEMRYYWEGNGTLQFTFPGGYSLVNTDCKKDHYWEWMKC